MSDKPTEKSWVLDLRLLREVFHESQELEKLNVLVVEDCDEDFFLLTRCLNAMCDYEVSISHAYDLDQALEISAETDFNLVIVDYWLGKDTGPNVLDRLGGRYGKAAAILITGLDHPAYKSAALKAGAIQCLGKDLLTGAVLQDVIHSVRLTHKVEMDLMNDAA